jgi:C4-dicarboxylate transporter, DctM subunit
MTFAWIGIAVLAICGAPLFVVIGSCALLAFYGSGGEGSYVIAELYGKMTAAPTLLAIPMFTFAGYMMAEGGTSARLLRLSKALLGWMPGGLAVVAIGTCAFFTAFTGASGVTIIALGGLLLPVLLKDRYSENFSLGLLTSCGSVGLLFPPSLPMILYGIVANRPDYPASVDSLFIAGVLPGILLVSLLSAYGVFSAIRAGVELIPFSFSELLRAIRETIWELPLPVVVLVGIYGGYFTANQAAAITAVYAFVVQVIIYRDLHPIRDLPRVARESMVLVGAILLILGVALGLTNYLIDQQVPDQILEFIRQRIHTQFVFLLALNLFLLVVGCLMDIFSAIIVVGPLVTPLAQEYHVDPIHLGIIFLMNLEIGYCHPPLGLNLFIASFRFNRSILRLTIAAIPFVLLMLLALIVITYWPDLSLSLGRWLGTNQSMAIDMN